MDEILTVEEAADYLKVSKTTIRRWCIREQLPAFKIGREWRIYKKELDRDDICNQVWAYSPQIPYGAISGDECGAFDIRGYFCYNAVSSYVDCKMTFRVL